MLPFRYRLCEKWGIFGVNKTTIWAKLSPQIVFLFVSFDAINKISK